MARLTAPAGGVVSVPEEKVARLLKAGFARIPEDSAPSEKPVVKKAAPRKRAPAKKTTKK